MYIYDTHVHTREVSSCSTLPAKDISKLYKDAGYDGIVVTDHYYKGFFDRLAGESWYTQIEQYLKGYKEVRKNGESIGLNVLLGLELRFNEKIDDYLVYGVDENLLISNPELYNMTLAEFRLFSRLHGLLVYQAHPFRVNMTPADPELIDGIEVYNGNINHNSHNDSSKEYARKHNLRPISGADAHRAVEVGRGGVYLPVMPKDSKEFVSALLSLENDEVKIIEKLD